MRTCCYFLAGAAIALVSPAIAQPTLRSVSNIHDSNKWTWSENTGWMNWRDGIGNANLGVRIHPGQLGFLSGYIWSENLGWIHLGNAVVADASPTRSYPNTSNTNYGVNIRPSGFLGGFAWSENVGWIFFDIGPVFDPPTAIARFYWGDGSNHGTFGYAWSENIGWINLDSFGSFIQLGCRADLDDGTALGNPDGGVDINDLLYFLTLFEAGDPEADLDDGSSLGFPDGGTDINDLLYFLTHFESGC